MAFSYGARLRCERGRSRCLGNACEDLTVLAVMVDVELFEMPAERRGVPQLLGHPGVGGMGRHTDMHHPVRGNLEYKEGIERPIGGGDMMPGRGGLRRRQAA